MKIALLSNVTVDLLAGMLQPKAELYLSPGFDTWQQELINPMSGLYAFKPDAVVVLLHADAYADTWNNREKGCQTIDEWCSALQVVSANLPGVPVFVSSIDISNVTCHFGAEVRLEAYFENYLIERVQELHDNGKNI